MSNKIFFHEFTFLDCHGQRVVELFIGRTSDVLKDPIVAHALRFDSDDSPAMLETLFMVKTIRKADVTKYNRINIIN
jgi:hypothetical protein